MNAGAAPARDAAKGAGSCSLAEVPVGGSARIVSIDGRGGDVQRLMEMGLTPGATVSVVRLAPLKDPIEVRLRGYLLSIRVADARRVRVAPE